MPLSMNGEGLLEGMRFTTSRQVIAAPLHSWRGARGSGGEVCASFDAWPETQPFQEPLAIHGEGHRGSGGEVCASFDAWPNGARRRALADVCAARSALQPPAVPGGGG